MNPVFTPGPRRGNRCANALLHNTTGAVFVEFLAAIVPVLVFFFGLLQSALLLAASLVVQHAAVCAARAAIVVLHDDPRFYGGQLAGQTGGLRGKDVETAAALPMRASQDLSNLRVSFPSAPGAKDNTGEIAVGAVTRLRVEADFRCEIPLVSLIVCDAKTGVYHLSAEAAMPDQGAPYVPMSQSEWQLGIKL